MTKMKIRVFKENEYSVKFDMLTDDLPEKGDYHLVPVGKESEFIKEFIEGLQHTNIDLAQAFNLIREKIKKVKIS